MRKEIQDLTQKAVKELNAEIQKLRDQMAKNRMDLKVNKPKDSNILSKNRRRLAILQTIVSQKREEK